MAAGSAWVGPPRPEWPAGPFVALLDAIRRLHVETAGTVRVTAGHEAADLRITAMDGYLSEVARGTARRPGPTPPRPTAATDDLGGFLPPDGWAEVVLGSDGTVLAGWTAAGDFYAYAPTADIVRVCIDALTLAHQEPTP